MFICSQCTNKFTLDDVKAGNYFPSTGVCAGCYGKTAKNKSRCFGKKKKYDPSSIACGIECQDEKICKAFIRHIKQFQGDKHESR